LGQPSAINPPDLLVFSSANHAQLHWNLIDNLNPKSFQCSHAFGLVRKQTNAPQLQVRENLRPDSNLALRLLSRIEQRGQFESMVKDKPCPLPNLFYTKTF